jgi:hypothetical protein
MRGEQKMNLKRFAVTAFAISLVVASILPAIAQTSKGILAGMVRDKTGAVVPGAKVTLASQDKRPQVAGFQTANTHDINVVPSIVTTYDPVLTVGRAKKKSELCFCGGSAGF